METSYGDKTYWDVTYGDVLSLYQNSKMTPPFSLPGGSFQEGFLVEVFLLCKKVLEGPQAAPVAQ